MPFLPTGVTMWAASQARNNRPACIGLGDVAVQAHGVTVTGPGQLVVPRSHFVGRSANDSCAHADQRPCAIPPGQLRRRPGRYHDRPWHLPVRGSDVPGGGGRGLRIRAKPLSLCSGQPGPPGRRAGCLLS
jgi:hypothetical protein